MNCPRSTSSSFRMRTSIISTYERFIVYRAVGRRGDRRRSWTTQPVGSTGCPSGTKWVDLAIMSIGCYNPWIRTHCNPEQAIQMANDAGAKFIMPVHHQTFRLSFEPFREPIERFEAALRDQ